MVVCKDIDIRDSLELSRFVENLSIKFPYKDVFTANTPIKIGMHSHDDYEARLFLEGKATFYIGNVQYNCVPGSYIEIDPEVKHSFVSDKNSSLRVLRFFSKEQKWVANFCPD